MDDHDVPITIEIGLKCLNVEEAAFHDNIVESNTPSNQCSQPVSRTDQECFRNSHSNQDLQKESKSKDLPVKCCVVECENGETFIADHVIMTASLGMYQVQREVSYFILKYFYVRKVIFPRLQLASKTRVKQSLVAQKLV